jgi:competence protein ComEC
VLAVLLAGASLGKVRVDSLVAPEITREMSIALSGRVIDRETRAGLRPRVLLDRIVTDAIAPEAIPPRLRVTFSPSAGLPPLGARIALRAHVSPIPGAMVPGGYDPHRAAFFAGIGGGGFALGKWTLEAPPRFSLMLMVAELRAAMVARIVAVLPGDAGAMAAALLVGERSGISEAANDNLRIAGLAHILSISGLHMMLIAGTAFFTIRAILALSPRLALRYPIRKWAAAGALLTVTFYLRCRAAARRRSAPM